MLSVTRGTYCPNTGLLLQKPYLVCQKWTHVVSRPNPIRLVELDCNCVILHPDKGLQPEEQKIQYTDSGYPYVDFCGNRLYLHAMSWIYMHKGKLPGEGMV
jgi:hypothetical protein